MIHAARKIDERAIQRFHMEEVPTGSLIGSVELVKVERLTATMWTELADEHLDAGAFIPNLYAWYFDEPRPLSIPLPYRGDRGLFEVSINDELARDVGLQLLERWQEPTD